jgi:hypothetical protein
MSSLNHLLVFAFRLVVLNYTRNSDLNLERREPGFESPQPALGAGDVSWEIKPTGRLTRPRPGGVHWDNYQMITETKTVIIPSWLSVSVHPMTLLCKNQAHHKEQPFPSFQTRPSAQLE